MTGKHRRGRIPDPRQTDLFHLLEGAIALPPVPPAPPPVGMNFDQTFRRLLKEAIAAGPFANRDGLAEAVSAYCGRRITAAMINSWTGASRPHAFPAALIPAFCAALGNTVLVQGVAEAAGCGVTESADLIRSRLDRLALFIRFARAEKRRLVAGTPLFGGKAATHG